jgi:hypothetical protein
MSLALSASVRPSPTLMYMVMTMCALSNALLAYCALAQVAGNPYWLTVLAGAGILSWISLVRFLRKRSSFQIDISATGEIILRTVSADSEVLHHERVHLAQESTLWPQMMLLHFRSETGQTTVFPVLRDSVDINTFRRLSVAFQWIAMHASTNQKSNLSQGNF